MHTADWIVLSLYLLATVGIGVMLGRKEKSTSDLFAAGGASPWWASGLSAFMNIFSANTFVVWGGMAYEHGTVAIMVNLCYGVAALLPINSGQRMIIFRFAFSIALSGAAMLFCAKDKTNPTQP